MPSEEYTTIAREMPHSDLAEKSVIAAMLMDRDAIYTASTVIGKDDFYSKHFGTIFQAIKDINDEQGTVDIVTLQNKLNQLSMPAEINNAAFFGNLVTELPSSRQVREYANIVYEKSVLRKLIRTTKEIGDACFLGKDDTDTLLEETEKKVFSLLQNRSGNEVRPIDDILKEAVDRIAKAYQTKGNITGIPTGFTDLDYKMAGLQNSDLVLVAARPSMGKTAFVLNIAHHVVTRENKSVAIFSLEMSEVQLINRMLSLESSVNAGKMRIGDLNDEEWDNLLIGADRLGKTKLFIDATPGITASELRSKCRKFKVENGLDLVIIDYLQLMSGSGKGAASDSRNQEISEISRSLKAVARELDVPVIALSQLSRSVEGRSDKRPMLSDLRDSGAIEQDADVVMFIYRDDYYNKDSKEQGVAEINIAKQRNGPIGTTKLAWLGEYTKFANLEGEQRYAKQEEY
ncbi:MAG: replicative DNA helicase [Lachnospiraceae bacterium]|nr:replicative DNA helicase [Lachnospiraceae bacterium]